MQRTDGIADFVRSGTLARFSRPSVVDSDDTELKLASFNQVRNSERCARYWLGIDWRPVTMALDWQLLHFITYISIPQQNKNTLQMLQETVNDKIVHLCNYGVRNITADKKTRIIGNIMTAMDTKNVFIEKLHIKYYYISLI